MKDIRLYINGKLVDIDESTNLPFNYQLEDFDNPTTVKVNHSSTITLKGTKNNNKLFGEIYNVERMQHFDQGYYGINFNPSKRVDYQLFDNGTLIESGYCQLNDINIINKDINYNITLYGGLGDFFYGLKYKEDGTAKTLADLRYFIQDEYGNTLDEASEMTFKVNKELIDQSFSKDWNYTGNTLTDYIAFIPAYNGQYSNFDSSKCIVNTNGLQTAILPESITNNDVTYTTYNGYGLLNLNNEYNEWEMRELRSYFQRPAIKLDKLIQTICRKENSGYEVVYDQSFFNKYNPYWSKTFIALPLLTSNDYDTESTISNDVELMGYGTISQDFTQVNNPVFINDLAYEVDDDGVIDLSGAADGSIANLRMDVQLNAQCSSQAQELYMYTDDGTSAANFAIATYLTVENADTGEVLGSSNAYQFQSGAVTLPGVVVVLPPVDVSTSKVEGHFYKIEGSRYLYKSNEGETSFRMLISDCLLANRIKVSLHTIMGPSVKTSYKLTPNIFYPTYYPFTANVSTTGGQFSVDLITGISSNVEITKKMLLSTENTPCDFLLSYAKRFGLYFIKDINEKKVTICSRNTFFTGETVSLDDKIDYSKDMTITPLLFDKKYYKLALNTPDTRWAKKYFSNYEQTYGQKRIDTGYNFNSETKSLYEDNIYQGVLPILDSDKYYRVYKDKYGATIPPFFCDNVTYELFNGDDSATEDIYGVEVVDRGIVAGYNNIPGADMWPKTCFFSIDNDSKSLEEISSCILFWNGIKNCKDNKGEPVTYTLTDDVREMNKLNDKQACWLYTDSLTDQSGNYIAIKRTSLPQYLPYIENNGIVEYSLDFGLPKEVYLDNLVYTEDSTVYDRFWKNFYRDQFHIDTKKVTCYVKLDTMSQDALRKFYWWNNAIWLLNKVNNYDITNNGTVQCEFVKVQDIDNYTNGQRI